MSSSPDDPPYPDGGIPRLRKGVAVGVERSDSEREAISYRDAYCRHPRLAFRRYSEQILTSPTEQTISGLGWNATWRSAHSRRPITYRQRSVPDSKLVTSAEEAIRILLGDRSTEHSETERSGAASSSDRRVRDRGTGSFTLRSSYAPTPDMDDNKGKSQVEKTKAIHPIRTKATSTNTKDRMELAKTERKDTAKEVRTEQTESTNSDNPNQLRTNEDAKLERVDNSNKSNIDCSCSVSKTTGSSGSSVDNAEWYVGSVNGGNPVTGEVLDTHQSVKVSEHLASKPRLKPDDSSTKRELCSSEMTSNKHQPENGEKPAVEKKEQTWTSRLFGKLTQRWDQSRQKQIPESVSPESSEVTENGPASEKTPATSELTVASSPALVETSDDGEVGLASISSTTSSASSGKPENAISEVDITIPEQSEMTSHFDVDDSSTTSKSASSEIDDDSKQEDNQLYTAPDDVFMTEHVDEKNVSSDKIKTKVSTFSIQMSAPATDNNEGHSPKSIDKDVTEITNERTGLADTDTAVNPDTSSVAASTSTEKAGHSETTRLDSVVVVDKVDPEPMVDNAVEELVASRPEMGAVRQRSHSTPCPTNGALTVAIEPVGGLVTGCDVTNEVNEFQHEAPEIRSPLISGYSQLTSELIRAKLREKRESTMNQMDDGGHPESNLDAVRMDIPPHLEPYMFARNTRHTISPEETLKRIEMLKKRRRYLSSGNLLDSDTADDADGDAETQTDASEMYVRTEEKVLTQIRRMKELQLEKKAQMEGMLALRVRSEPASREANGRQKEETHGEADEDITDDYLRSQKIERTAEKLDWFRHKRQTADNMCNARLNRLLAGVGQRYAEHQLEVVSKYINPSSHAADLILSGSRANRTTTPTSTFNGRRSISTDRIHLQGNDEHGSKFRFYTSNPFDV